MNLSPFFFLSKFFFNSDLILSFIIRDLIHEVVYLLFQTQLPNDLLYDC